MSYENYLKRKLNFFTAKLEDLTSELEDIEEELKQAQVKVDGLEIKQSLKVLLIEALETEIEKIEKRIGEKKWVK